MFSPRTSSTSPGGTLPQPVRVRVYGFLMTRRVYLRLLTAGVLLLLVVLVVRLTIVDLPQPSGKEPPLPSDFFLTIVNKYVPWMVLAAVILESIEAAFVLRRFAREQAKQGVSPGSTQRTPKL